MPTHEFVALAKAAAIHLGSPRPRLLKRRPPHPLLSSRRRPGSIGRKALAFDHVSPTQQACSDRAAESWVPTFVGMTVCNVTRLQPRKRGPGHAPAIKRRQMTEILDSRLRGDDGSGLSGGRHGLCPTACRCARVLGTYAGGAKQIGDCRYYGAHR